MNARIYCSRCRDVASIIQTWRDMARRSTVALVRCHEENRLVYLRDSLRDDPISDELQEFLWSGLEDVAEPEQLEDMRDEITRRMAHDKSMRDAIELVLSTRIGLPCHFESDWHDVAADMLRERQVRAALQLIADCAPDLFARFAREQRSSKPS